jgi:hypothetical protein
MIKQASDVILICADTRLSKYDVEFWVQDCASAMENLLVAVQDLGLGAVWLDVYPLQERVVEHENNPDYKTQGYNDLKKKMKSDSFTMTLKQWIEQTGAIGLKSR